MLNLISLAHRESWASHPVLQTKVYSTKWLHQHLNLVECVQKCCSWHFNSRCAEMLCMTLGSGARATQLCPTRKIPLFSSLKRILKSSLAYSLLESIYSKSGVPIPQGHGQVLVHGLLGTELHSRRYMTGEQATLHLLLTVAPHRLHYCLSSASCSTNSINVMCSNHPTTIPPTQYSPWENCLPWSQSLVPKRLGTSALEHELPPFHSLIKE